LGKILGWLDALIRRLTAATTALAGGCLLITALIVTYEVVMRGLFDAPTEWSIEVSVYLVVVSGFLGLAVTYAEDKHIRVDLLTSKLSARANRRLEVFVGAVSLVFCLIFLVESWDMVAVSYQLNRTAASALRVPLFLPQLALPVGFLLMLLQLVRKLIIDLAGLNNTADAAGKRQEG
jgi:TRAP-type C4-dicarboxylate transport system permease small subunit